MSFLPRVATLVVSIFFSLGCFIFFASELGIHDVEIFGFQFRGTEVPLWHGLVAFATTLLGVIFAFFIEELLTNREAFRKAHKWPFFAKRVLAYVTPLSIVVAAIAYIFVFERIFADVGDLAAYFSAFQSGFLFRQILRTLLLGSDSEDAAATSSPA